MPRPKLIEEPSRVSCVISKKQLKQIERAAINMAKQEGRMIGVSEAIRMAIETAYPVPKEVKQMELF